MDAEMDYRAQTRKGLTPGLSTMCNPNTDLLYGKSYIHRNRPIPDVHVPTNFIGLKHMKQPFLGGNEFRALTMSKWNDSKLHIPEKLVLVTAKVNKWFH